MMRFVRRPLAAVVRLAVVALVFLLGSALAAKGIPARPVDDPASASPCLKYLPKDCWAVGELNWRAVVEFLNRPESRQNPQRAQFDQLMRMIKILTGIDAEKQVDRVTVFATFDPDTVIAGAVAIHGSFNNLFVEGQLRLTLAATAVQETHHLHTVYRVNDVSFSLPGRSTILVGADRVVRDALDRFDAAPIGMPESLQNVLDRTPADALAWVVLRPPAILARPELAPWRREHAALSANLRKVESLALAIGADGEGMRVDALGYVSEPDEATVVHRYLRDRKRDLLHAEGANVLLASFLVLSDLEQRGTDVGGAFGVDLDGLKELWETKFIIKP